MTEISGKYYDNAGGVPINVYRERLEKIAKGYEVEEVQTIVEETTSGTKKKIVRTKRHIPPNFHANKYLMSMDVTAEKTANVLKFNELRLDE